MPRRRTNRPVEELRSTWTSTADLEETIAAMFPSRPEDKLSPATSLPRAPNPHEPSNLGIHPADKLSPTTEDKLTPAPEDNMSPAPADKLTSDPEDKLTPPPVVNLTPPPEDNLAPAPGDNLTPAQDVTSRPDRRPMAATGPPEDKLSPGSGLDVRPEDKLAPPPGDSLPGVRYLTINNEVVNHRFVQRCDNVQGAHTPSEHLVYTTMWKALGSREDEGSAREGNLSMSLIMSRVSISKRNLRRVLQSLVEKFAIEVTEYEDRTRSIPKKYRVWGFKATIERRQQAGFAYVYRNRNLITLARIESSRPEVNLTPGAGDNLSLGGGDNLTPGGEDRLTGGPPDNLTPNPEDNLSPFLINKESNRKTTSSSAPALIVEAILRDFGFVDDDAIQILIRKCRENAPDATDEEIAELGAMAARKVARMRNLEKPVGMLISQAAKFFVGAPFAVYRRERAEREERLRQLYEE